MKLITTAAGIALALTLGLTQVSGTAVRGNARPMMSQSKCCQACFVDTDNDGICDNRGSGNFVDADGDGICDNRGSGKFVDADGDGICDNRGSGNFVDADGDGICDNRGSGNGACRGNGGNRCGQGKKCR